MQLYYSDCFSREAAHNFVNTDKNTSYGNGRTLPLLPSEAPSAPKDHIYELPGQFGIQNQTQTTSFSANADVIPRLGTLKGQKSRYIDLKIDPGSQKPVPVPAPSQPGQMHGEEFYDKVYDDGYDRPRPLGRDLGDVSHNTWPYAKEESVSSASGGSESTGFSKVTGDGYDTPRSIARELMRDIAEDAQPKAAWVFSSSAGAESTRMSTVTDDIQAVDVFSADTLPLERGSRRSGEVALNPLYDPKAKK